MINVPIMTISNNINQEIQANVVLGLREATENKLSGTTLMDGVCLFMKYGEFSLA